MQDAQQSNVTLRLKNNLSKNSGNIASTFMDKESKKVIDFNSNQKGTCFGSSQARFDENERILHKQNPHKLGPGAYQSKFNYEPKGKNFSTRFIGNSLM